MARAGQPLFVGIGRRQSQDDGSLPRAAAPFMTASPLRLLLLLLAVLILAGSPVAMASPAPVPPPLTAELERLYASWKTAMSSRDLAAWSRTTARARQMMVRNTIVSQKRDWPRSLFALAMTPPEIRGLRLAGSQLLGAEARLVYHGRIDFQIDDPRRPPDAVLVLDFVQEAAGYTASIVAGTVTRSDDTDTGARPGTLVRSTP